jgi:Flp pilus assembly protein TadD
MASHNLGLYMVDAKRFDTAIPLLWKGMALNHYDPASRRDLANALATAGRHAEAVAEFTEVAREWPDDAGVQDKLANSLAQTGAVDQAVVHWRRAIALRPDLSEAHYNLGAILYSRGKRAEAAAEFRAALRSDPNSTQAQQALALAEKGAAR